MKSKYKRIGGFIRLVDNRNKDLKVTNLLGVSIQKKSIPSIANITNTDMSVYRIIKKNQFAFSPVTSRNGEKITIALLKEEDDEIIPIEVKAGENLRSNSFCLFCQKNNPLRAIRTSLSDYKEEAWMTNIPLYGISTV